MSHPNSILYITPEGKSAAIRPMLPNYNVSVDIDELLTNEHIQNSIKEISNYKKISSILKSEDEILNYYFTCTQN